MSHTKLMFFFGLAAALAGLSGCGGKIRYPNYYVLNVPAPPSSTDPGKPVLGAVAVREFRAPAFLKEGSIVYRQSPEQLDFYAYHRWAEDPRRVATQALVRELQSRGLFESVDAYDGRASQEYLVTGTLEHLEEVDSGSKVSIEVSLAAQLINVRTGELLWRGESTKTSTVDERSVPGIVAEMSRDLGSAVASLVSSMQNHLSTTSIVNTASSKE